MVRKKHQLTLLLLLSAGTGLAREQPLSPASFKRHVSELADDSMAGRALGTPGAEAAARYIARWFERAGLEPLDDGRYAMDVPLVGWRRDPGGDSFTWTLGGERAALPRAAFAAKSESLEESIDVSARVVFLGYGISRPELGWDDYESVDASGALVAVRPGLAPCEAHRFPGGEHGFAAQDEAKLEAAGVSALIELARSFASREERLPRTLIFLATTAEEHGSLGAYFYADRPIVPLKQTVTVLNLDGINVISPTEDFIVFPSQGVDASETLGRISRASGMRLSAEAGQLGMHFSFDTEPFLLRGLAGLTLWQGSAYRSVSSEEARRRWSRFGRIHTPADEWPGDGDDEAIAQHLELYRIAVETFARSAPRPAVSLGRP